MCQSIRRKPNLLANSGIIKNETTSGHYLIACEAGRIDSKQIESSRITLNRKIKKYGKLVIKIFPNVPVTKKPAEVRMGQGKGAVDRWICRIRPQRILFRIPATIPKAIAYNALTATGKKLPLKTKVIIS